MKIRSSPTLLHDLLGNECPRNVDELRLAASDPASQVSELIEYFRSIARAELDVSSFIALAAVHGIRHEENFENL